MAMLANYARIMKRLSTPICYDNEATMKSTIINSTKWSVAFLAKQKLASFY